jgi:hypothetical protein
LNFLSPSPFAKKCATEKPIIDYSLKGENLLSQATELNRFNMKTLQIGEAYEKTIQTFSFKIERNGNFHGFGCWFDVMFNGSDPKKQVILSTSPNHK